MPFGLGGADAFRSWQAVLSGNARAARYGLAGARSLDEAPEPSAPVGRQNNVVGAVEDCSCLRRSDRHRGRSWT